MVLRTCLFMEALKLEFPKHDVLEIEKNQDDLESCILKARCDKAMLARLMKNWKECEESALWGFVKQGPYYLCNNHEEKTMGKRVMYCVPCGVEIEY